MEKLKSKLLWHLLMKKESSWAKKVPAMVNGLRSLYKTLLEMEDNDVPLDESKRNTTDPSVAISDSSVTDYDSADESSVCSIHLSPLEKLAGTEPVSRPKTIKSILKSNFTFKAEIFVHQHHTSQGKSSSRSRSLRPAIPFPFCIHCRSISLRRGIKHRNPQHVTKNCETCGSNVYTTTDHNDIEWFRKREAL
ncbi:hypothetical protein Tco_1410850 [Tanacetum coccineum]